MGSYSPLAMLLRGIGKGQPRMGTDDGGGWALCGDNVEEDGNGSEG